MSLRSPVASVGFFKEPHDVSLVMLEVRKVMDHVFPASFGPGLRIKPHDCHIARSLLLAVQEAQDGQPGKNVHYG